MSVRVRWFATLVKRTRSKQSVTDVEWRPGLTPMAIFLDEGFAEVDAQPVMAIVNGGQSTMEAALNDGDELEFLIGISGGCDGGTGRTTRHRARRLRPYSKQSIAKDRGA